MFCFRWTWGHAKEDFYEMDKCTACKGTVFMYIVMFKTRLIITVDIKNRQCIPSQ